MARINPNFAQEIKKYGARDFEACFNCGTCTATCGLTEQNANFPRKFVRSGVLGQREDLLNSKEIWLCYACGDCSTNCPRQAAPAEYMAAVRRYAIANYEPTGLTKLIFKSNPFSIFLTLFLAVILGFFLLTIKPDNIVSRWIFEWMPYEILHTMGLIIFSITGISMVWGIISMWRKLSSGLDQKARQKTAKISEAFQKTGDELATMRRYRNCDTEDESFWNTKKGYERPWFIHWSVMWGFIGLLLATILDFMFKDPATDIWFPSRLLGTLAGLLLIYGTSMALYYRLTKITKAYSSTKLADWMFLGFLFVAGITGFWLEASITLNASNSTNQIVFVIHTIISMQLVLLFAFSKFAHAIYRPLALFHYYYHAPQKQK